MTRFLFALLLGAIGIAFAPVLAKLAVQYDAAVSSELLSPVAVAFWRMLLATPVFAAFVILSKAKDLEEQPKILRFAQDDKRLWLLALPGFFFAADLATWHWSFEFTSVANSTLEANLAAVIVPLAGWLWLGEKFTRTFVIGAGLAVLGMGVLVGPSFGEGGDAWIGDLMGIGTAFAYTGYQLSTKVLVGRYSVKTVMFAVSVVSSVFLAGLAWVSPGHFMPVTAKAWAAVIALSLVSQVFGQGLIAYGMRGVSVGLASVILILQPATAAVLGWIILGQPLSARQGIAALVILLGIYLAKRGASVGRRVA